MLPLIRLIPRGGLAGIRAEAAQSVAMSLRQRQAAGSAEGKDDSERDS